MTVLRMIDAVRDWPAKAREKAVLWALISRLDKRLECWPALPMIALDAGVSRSSVIRALHIAQTDPRCPIGIKTTIRLQAGKAGEASTKYRLTLRDLPGVTLEPGFTVTPGFSLEPGFTVTPHPVSQGNPTPCQGETLRTPEKDPKEGPHSFSSEEPSPETEPEPEPEPSKEKSKAQKPNGKADAVLLVWTRYVEGWRTHVHHGTEPKLTPQRKRQIAARLKSYDTEALCRAVDALFADGFMMGGNDEGRVFAEPDQVFGSDAKVEKRLASTAKRGAPRVQPAPKEGSAWVKACWNCGEASGGFNCPKCNAVVREPGKFFGVDGPDMRTKAKEIYLEMYQTSRRRYGRYVQSPRAEAAYADLAAAALRVALEEVGERGSGDQNALAEECLRHWYASFLRDDGRNDYLSERRHPVEDLPRSLTEYGLPKGWGEDFRGYTAEEEETANDPPNTEYCGPPPEFEAMIRSLGRLE